MRVYRVTVRDAQRLLNLREGKNEEDAVLTSYSPNENYMHPSILPPFPRMTYASKCKYMLLVGITQKNQKKNSTNFSEANFTYGMGG